MNTHTDISNWADRLRDFMARSLEIPWRQSSELHESFNTFALERFAWQAAHNPVLRPWMERQGILHPSHWTEIPALPAAAFKEFEVSCIPGPERTAVFHSSGTTGASTSRHYHHRASLDLYEASLWLWFQRHLGGGEDWPRLVFLTPSPKQAPHSSLVHMFETIRRNIRSEHALFAGGVDDATGAWNLHAARVESLLELAARAGEPLAILGTAFNFVQLLDHLEAMGRRHELPPGSWVMETGGYKGRTRSMAKDELHEWIEERLGVPRSRIVSEYGMSELSSQAYDGAIACAACPDTAVVPAQARIHDAYQDSSGTGDATGGVFHFPPWARARVVSPEHGREVPVGETGVIQIVDLANAWSMVALRTEDLGVRREHGFELVGRIPSAEPKGCSLHAVS